MNKNLLIAIFLVGIICVEFGHGKIMLININIIFYLLFKVFNVINMIIVLVDVHHYHQASSNANLVKANVGYEMKKIFLKRILDHIIYF